MGATSRHITPHHAWCEHTLYLQQCCNFFHAPRRAAPRHAAHSVNEPLMGTALYEWLTQYRQRTKSVEAMLSGGHRQHLIVGAELTQLLLNHVDIGPASAPHIFSWGLMHETASLPRDQVQPVFIERGHSTIKVQYVSQRCLQTMRLTLTKCAAFMCQHQNNRGYMVILKVALTEAVSGMFTHNHSHTQYGNLR